MTKNWCGLHWKHIAQQCGQKGTPKSVRWAMHDIRTGCGHLRVWREEAYIMYTFSAYKCTLMVSQWLPQATRCRQEYILCGVCDWQPPLVNTTDAISIRFPITTASWMTVDFGDARYFHFVATVCGKPNNVIIAIIAKNVRNARMICQFQLQNRLHNSIDETGTVHISSISVCARRPTVIDSLLGKSCSLAWIAEEKNMYEIVLNFT